MNNDNQIKHHLYWILVSMGFIKPEDRQATYAKIMETDLSEDTCNEIDKLVAHIKLNY
jgi:hypothetical protein